MEVLHYDPQILVDITVRAIPCKNVGQGLKKIWGSAISKQGGWGVRVTAWGEGLAI